MPGLERQTAGGKNLRQVYRGALVKVVRRPLFTWLPVTAGVALYAFALWAAEWRREDGGAPALVFATGALFFWAIGWDSAIRYTATHLSITNLLVTSTVAWRDVASVTLDDGLQIQLRDEREMSSIAFGGSLIGAFTGYRTYHKAHRLLRDAHLHALQGDKGEGAVRLRWSVEWRRPLGAAAAVYGPLLIVLFVGS